MKKTRLDDLHEKRFIRMNRQGTGSILIAGLSPTNDIMFQGAKQKAGTETFDYANTKIYFSITELEAGEMVDYINTWKTAFNMGYPAPEQYPDVKFVHKTDVATKTFSIKGNVYTNQRTGVKEFQLGVSLHDSRKQTPVSIYLSKSEMTVLERILSNSLLTCLGAHHLLPSKIVVCDAEEYRKSGMLVPKTVPSTEEIEATLPKMTTGEYIFVKSENKMIAQVQFNIIKGYPVYFVV